MRNLSKHILRTKNLYSNRIGHYCNNVETLSICKEIPINDFDLRIYAAYTFDVTTTFQGRSLFRSYIRLDGTKTDEFGFIRIEEYTILDGFWYHLFIRVKIRPGTRESLQQYFSFLKINIINIPNPN